MTDWTPENNRIQTWLLNPTEIAAMSGAKHGWLVWDSAKGWQDLVGYPFWAGMDIYRAKPAPVTQDVVLLSALILARNRLQMCALDHQMGSRAQFERSEWAAEATSAIAQADSLQQRPVTVGAVTSPEKDAEYWVALPDNEDWATMLVWSNDGHDRRMFSRGLIYLTEADAVAAAKTMCAKGGV